MSTLFHPGDNVGISPDGSTLVVQASGPPGFVYVYKWDPQAEEFDTVGYQELVPDTKSSG
jgi:hypothetical protein